MSSPHPGEGHPARHPATLASLRRYTGPVVVSVLTAGLAAYLFSLLLPASYQAQSKIVLKERPEHELAEALGLGPMDTPHAEVQAGAAHTSEIVSHAVDIGGGDASAARLEALSRNLEVSADATAGTLTFTVSSTDPRVAASRANALARAYGEVTAERVGGAADVALAELAEAALEIERQMQALEAQMAALAAATADGQARRSALEVERLTARESLRETQLRRGEIRAAAAQYADGIALLDEADVPTAPVSPRPVRNAALAVLVVGPLALAAAWWRTEAHPVISTERELQAVVGTSCLARIPRLPGDLLQKAQSAEPLSVPDTLQLPAAIIEQLGRVTAITSAGPGEGKTLVALNLAKALADAGRTVLLVDADLRSGELTRHLGLTERAGLAELLTEESRRDDECIVRLSENLLVLPRGREVASPAAALRSKAFGRFAHGREAEIVIIDTPPLLAGPEAALIARQTTTVLLVARSGSPYEIVEDARRLLTVAQVSLDGCLLNDVPAPRHFLFRAVRRERAEDVPPRDASVVGMRTPL